jgi:hypothetical protein
MTVSHRSAVLAISLALALSIASLLAAAPAQARDFCFNSSLYSPAILVVAKDFKLPRKGKCRPIVGWDAGFFGFAVARPASGTACLNSVGDKLHVGVTIHATADDLGIANELQVHMQLPYPALNAGTVFLQRVDPYLAEFRGDGFAGDCGYAITIP